MRKILNILNLIILIFAIINNNIACEKINLNNNNSNVGLSTEFGPYNDTELNNLPIQHRQMVINTSLISKLILLGRNENLNYNINEILSMFLASNSVCERLPFMYTIVGNGKNGTLKGKEYQINLSRYINGFTHNMTDLRRLDNITKGYGGIYASYIMGMYQDEVYQNFSKNLRTNNKMLFGDTSDINGNFNNPQGYNGGLNSDLKLSYDKFRRNLSWGIQNTGALSNFLLINKYEGGNAGDPAASIGPASRPNNLTNYGGYMFYNSHLFNGKTKYTLDDPNKKLANKNIFIKGQKENIFEGLSLFKNNIDILNGKKWGSMQSFIPQQGGLLNISSNINSYLSMMHNLSETEIGASTEMEFINAMFPFLSNPKSYSGSVAYVLLIFTISAFLISLNYIAKNYEKIFLEKNSINTIELIKNTNEALDILVESELIQKYNNSYILPIINFQTGFPGKTISDLVGKNTKGRNYNFFVNFSKIVKIIIIMSNKWNKEKIIKFNQTIMGNVNSNKKYQLSWIFNFFKSGMIKLDSLYNGLFDEHFVNNLDIIGILTSLNNTFSVINNNINIFKKIKEKYIDNIGNMFDWNQLTLEQKRDIIELFGWNYGNFRNNSILSVIYKSLTDSSQPGYNSIHNILFTSTSPFQTMFQKQMQETQEKFLDNIILDNIWYIFNVQINGDMNQIGSTMSYIMDYKGNGDPSVIKYTKEQINIPDNFNPYQQSGIRSDGSQYIAKPLVNMADDEYIKYDGLSDYDSIIKHKVNHRYKIFWKNISKNINSPYWIIVNIECYDLNSKEQQFFNIY